MASPSTPARKHERSRHGADGAPTFWGRLVGSSPYRGFVALIDASPRGQFLILAALPILWVVTQHLGPMLQMLAVSFTEAYPVAPGAETGLCARELPAVLRGQHLLDAVLPHAGIRDGADAGGREAAGTGAARVEVHPATRWKEVLFCHARSGGGADAVGPDRGDEQGAIEQDGTPEELYFSPASRFVAEFIWKTSLLDGVVEGTEGGEVILDWHGHRLRGRAPKGAPRAGERVTASLRLERVQLRPERVQLRAERPETKMSFRRKWLAGRSRAAG